MKREDKKMKIMEDIVKSTMLMLNHRAWHTIKVEEICQNAHVSKRTLYTYYPSLDSLYLTLIKRAFMKRNDFLNISMQMDGEVNELLLSMARGMMKFSFEFPTEGLLINQYDERLYTDLYNETVEEISKIANHYELNQIFKMKHLDPTVYTPALALFLWSSVTGWIDLMQYKAKWIEHYYHENIDVLFEEHLEIIKNFLEDL